MGREQTYGSKRIKHLAFYRRRARAIREKKNRREPQDPDAKNNALEDHVMGDNRPTDCLQEGSVQSTDKHVMGSLVVDDTSHELANELSGSVVVDHIVDDPIDDYDSDECNNYIQKILQGDDSGWEENLRTNGDEENEDEDFLIDSEWEQLKRQPRSSTPTSTDDGKNDEIAYIYQRANEDDNEENDGEDDDDDDVLENIFQRNEADEEGAVDHWTLGVVPGNRVVDAEYLMNVCMARQQEHSEACLGGVLQVNKEKRSGFNTQVVISCDSCDYSTLVASQNPRSTEDLNIAAVWSAMVRGNTYQTVAESAAIMNIPPITKTMFYKIENKLHDKWKECSSKSIEQAGKEEKEEAIRRNHVDDDGVPWITTYVDCGWNSRSYGHRYTALSGVAVIVGKYTKKVLWAGVRNKFCAICARAKGRNQAPPPHRCFKNWEGSSPAMEADILVEGFNKSIEMHGVRYKQFIADGDSNSYARIQRDVAYGHEVTKLFCRNHLMKNFGKALYELQKDSAISSEARKILTKSKIRYMEEMATKIVYLDTTAEDVEVLKKHLEAVPLHPFGDHSKCDIGFCEAVNTVSNAELLRKMEQSGLAMYLEDTVHRHVIAQAHKLIANETNNRAELFFAYMCKYNAGKRLNLVTRGSFETRTYSSVLRYNEGAAWQIKCWEDITGRKPGVYFTKHMENLAHSLELRHGREIPRKRKRNEQDNEGNTQRPRQIAYGPHADQGMLTDEEFASERQRLLNKIAVTHDQIVQIEAETRGQWNNPLFIQRRKLRLSASTFGRVIHRRITTDPGKIIKDIIYPRDLRSASVNFGKRHENTALRKFEQQKHALVRPCGLFVDERLNFLSASPDGLVGENGIVEVKCCYTAHKLKLSLIEAVQLNKVDYLHEIEENGKKVIKLKERHNYFFQVQGQLHITKKDICFFIVFVGQDQPLFIQPILRRPEFFENKMEKPLTDFYFDHLLTAIIERDARMQRNV